MIRLMISLCLLLYLALAPAQGFTEASFSLSTDSLLEGERLELKGSGLRPEAEYNLTLSGPDDASIRESLIASPTGQLEYQLTLNEAGVWQLEVETEDGSVQFEVLVMPQQSDTGLASPDALVAEDTAQVPQDSQDRENPELGDEAQVTAPSDASPSEDDRPETVTDSEAQDGVPESETLQDSLTEPESTALQEVDGEVSEPESVSPQQTESPGETNLSSPESDPSTEEAAVALPDNGLPLELSTIDGRVTARQNAEVIWSLSFPANSGNTRSALIHGGAAYVGHGNSLLKLEPQTGTVLRRWLVSAQISDLSIREDSLVISAQPERGTAERFTLLDDKLQELVRFGVHPDMFTWLENEALVPDVEARRVQDPSNPWLHLAAGQRLSDTVAARAAYQQALNTAQSFYDFAGISRTLLAQGEIELADQAMDAALRDFAARGYDPRLLRDLVLHEAYSFPLQPLRNALSANDLTQAAFWAKWLRYFSSPNVPEVQEVLLDYSLALRRAGQRSEANQWRDLARLGQRSSVSNVLEGVFASLGRLGWYATVALLLATVSLHLTLLFKYWKPQSVIMRRKRKAGKKVSPLYRLLVMRYYSFTEKLVLLLLLLAVVMFAALAHWNDRTEELMIAEHASGTLASAVAQDYLANSTLQGDRGLFIQAYAAHTADNGQRARTLYEGLDSFAPALNNLAALTGDSAGYQTALSKSPALPEAQYNLGRNLNQFPFHQTYLANQPLLVVPSREDLQAALAGTWEAALAAPFLNPWTALRDLRPTGIPSWLWLLIQVLFLAWTVITLLWLFVPRPRLARNAPRSLGYHILSVLIPGSGAADEMWGLLLIIPWALLGLDTLSKLFAWGFGLDSSLNWNYVLLALIYLINLVAVIVEYVSYRRRMATLKRTQPELAEEFASV